MKPHVGQFVLVPRILQLEQKKLQYLDILVYASLRSFDNKQPGNCYPSHVGIAKRAGLSRRFVITSIGRLEKAGLITVHRSNKVKEPNQYWFEDKQVGLALSPIPIALFNVSCLTANQKAMLICLRQFFEHGYLQSTHTLQVMAFGLGLTVAKVYEQYRELVAKNYIAEAVMQPKTSKACKRLTLHKMFDVGGQVGRITLRLQVA